MDDAVIPFEAAAHHRLVQGAQGTLLRDRNEHVAALHVIERSRRISFPEALKVAAGEIKSREQGKNQRQPFPYPFAAGHAALDHKRDGPEAFFFAVTFAAS